MVGDGAPTGAMPGSSTEMVGRAFCLYSPFTIAIQVIASDSFLGALAHGKSINPQTDVWHHRNYGRNIGRHHGVCPDGQWAQDEKKYGIGLPRDHASQLFTDADYPVFPLKPGQDAYRDIDAARMKRDIIALSNIALQYRDTVNKQWWGRFPGTDADRAGMKFMTDEFTRLGLKVETFPYVLPRDWRPAAWNLSYTSSKGAKIDVATAFPVSGTKGTSPEGITAEAIWVGIGAAPDFLDRDVRGKAVIIYSTFVPGGRSHSASDRAGLFNANARAQQLGAAMVINVMAVPATASSSPRVDCAAFRK